MIFVAFDVSLGLVCAKFVIHDNVLLTAVFVSVIKQSVKADGPLVFGNVTEQTAPLQVQHVWQGR